MRFRCCGSCRFRQQQVKRYIDLLAFHRLNHFHWHLTDDQGWRIEIKKYPKLTDLSAWIMGPQSISVFVSSDGEQYEKVALRTYEAPTDAMREKRSELNRLSFDILSARYVKVVAEPFKGLPKRHSGEGERPFLFVDEIRVD